MKHRTRVWKSYFLVYFEVFRIKICQKKRVNYIKFVIATKLRKLHSQIRTTWNSNNDEDLSLWIGEQLCMKMVFWQLSRNADKCVMPGKLSEIHFHAWSFSNPLGKVLKSIKSRWQICPILLGRKKDLSPWIGEQPCM